MIAFTKSYKTSDDQLFGSVEEAKTHELELVFKNNDLTKDVAMGFSMVIMENKDIILDILTTTVTSKPKARAIHGGTKKRIKPSDPLSGVIGAIPATNA
jgi:hypothetical protein